MIRKAFVLGLMILLGGASFVQAEDKPVQLSLFNPIQLFPEEDSVEYFRWNFIYGVNDNVRGLDLGLVSRTTGIQRGLQSGLVNIVAEDFHGWQNGFINVDEGSGKSIGLQTGFVSYVNGDYSGLQWGTVNIVKGTYRGAQVGFYNYANDMHGLQFGFINVAENIDGIQIGLANVNQSKDPFWVLPFVNGKF